MPGVAMWSVWQPERNFFFNSFFIETPQGNLVVDPPGRLLETDAAEIAARAAASRGSSLRIADHERAARPVAERFGAKIAAGALEANLLSAPVDRLLQDGDEVCGAATVVALEGLENGGRIRAPSRRALGPSSSAMRSGAIPPAVCGSCPTISSRIRHARRYRYANYARCSRNISCSATARASSAKRTARFGRASKRAPTST